MLRKIAIPRTEEFIFHLPKEYLNKQVEFIAFPIEEEAKAKTRKRPGYGALKGKIHISDDFDAPLDDLKEYMR